MLPFNIEPFKINQTSFCSLLVALLLYSYSFVICLTCFRCCFFDIFTKKPTLLVRVVYCLLFKHHRVFLYSLVLFVHPSLFFANNLPRSSSNFLLYWVKCFSIIISKFLYLFCFLSPLCLLWHFYLIGSIFIKR